MSGKTYENIENEHDFRRGIMVLTGNLVSESLRLDDRNVIDDTLVGVEIVGESKQTLRQR